MMKRKFKIVSLLLVLSLVVLGVVSAARAAGLGIPSDIFPLSSSSSDAAVAGDSAPREQPKDGNLQVKLPAGWQLVIVPSVGMELLFPANPVAASTAQASVQTKPATGNPKNNNPEERKWEIQTPNTRIWSTHKWNTTATKTLPPATGKSARSVKPGDASYTQSIGFRWSSPASGEGLQDSNLPTPVVVIYSTLTENAGKIYTIRIYLPDRKTGETRTIDINISASGEKLSPSNFHLVGSDDTPESIPAPDLLKLLYSTSLFD